MISADFSGLILGKGSGMRMLQEDFVVPQMRHTLASNAESADIKEKGPPSARVVLREIFNLLEEYAPTWYTEAHHDRIVAALSNRPTSQSQ